MNIDTLKTVVDAIFAYVEGVFKGRPLLLLAIEAVHQAVLMGLPLIFANLQKQGVAK